jgi:futalosine hydrolase
MNILLVAATKSEVEPLLKELVKVPAEAGFNLGRLRVKCLISGVGMFATTFAMAKELSIQPYDLAINAGIAGSFDRDFSLGQVLHVTDDNFADFGVEDGNQFISMNDLGLGLNHYEPIDPNLKSSSLDRITKARAITVNKVHGDEMSISATAARLNPQLESMEGAAFFYACSQFSLPSVQIRAVSNYVERRNRDQWNIPLAIDNLNQFLCTFMKDLA